MKRLIKSFVYAFSGFAKAVRTERNLRIHISAAAFVTAFAYFFGITRYEWAILFLVMGFVVAAELFNTAIEWCSDSVTKENNTYIKHAKDIAASGVTMSAITSVAVGAALFGDIEKIVNTLKYITGNASALAVFAVIIIADIVFLVFVGETKKDN